MAPIFKEDFLLLDGPTGTELTRRGYQANLPLWTARAALDAPDLLRSIHLDYLRAGARIVTANTFRTSSYTLLKTGMTQKEASRVARQLAHASLAAATEAIEEFGDGKRVFLAGSLAPLEDCYQPRLVPQLNALETTHFETAGWLVEAGAEVVLIETMGTAREALVAVRAARKAGAPSIMVSFITEQTGRRLLGGDSLVETAQACAEQGAEVVLVNCVHADVVDKALVELKPLLERGIVLGAYANASRMQVGPGGEVSWEPDSRPEAERAAEYGQRAAAWVRRFGASIVGACCGTTPAYIAELTRALRSR